MDLDATTVTVLGLVTLQAIQLAQTAMLGRVVRKSLRPPPPQSQYPRDRGDQTPSERMALRKRDRNE